MEILDTIVNTEIDKIMRGPRLAGNHRWDLYIKANGVEIHALRVVDLKLDRLYIENFADELRVTFIVVADEYFNTLLPFKTTLEATLIKTPLTTADTAVVDHNTPRQSNHYRMQLIDISSEIIAGDNPLAVNKTQASQLSLKTLTAQLYNPVIDQLRKRTFGTVFRDTKAIDAIQYVLTKIGKIDGVDTANAILGAEIAKGASNEIRKHIIVPDLTPFIKVPRIIDQAVGGVYPSGLGFYLQQNLWHVFGQYDLTRYGSATPSLTIIKIPSFRLPGTDKTYRVDQGQIVILSTRETKHVDHSETLQLNAGNATRFIDANKLMDQFGVIGGNKFISEQKDKVTEIALEPRPEGNMTTTGALITSDYYREYQKLVMKSGALIQTIWENSDPDLLIPGMPVRYIFADGKKPQVLYGLLQAVETLDYSTTENVTHPRFTTMCLLTLFVSRKDPTQVVNPTATITQTKG